MSHTHIEFETVFTLKFRQLKKWILKYWLYFWWHYLPLLPVIFASYLYLNQISFLNLFHFFKHKSCAQKASGTWTHWMNSATHIAEGHSKDLGIVRWTWIPDNVFAAELGQA